jgi:imidazolonepropionase-like amidohydrolase
VSLETRDDPEHERRIASAIHEASASRWSLRCVRSERAGVCLEIEPGRGAEPLLLDVRPARAGERSYRTLDGLAFSYRGRDLQPAVRARLDGVIAELATVLDLDRLARAETTPVPTGEHLEGFPTPRQRAHLERARGLPAETIEAFRRDGHVLVRRAVDPDVVMAARSVVEAALARLWPSDQLPVDRRPDAYSQSFTQITDVGLCDSVVRAFTHAPRIAKMAADLMGVERVRLFCEDWLIKEPGARITPWHQDEAVFPFDADITITCWIPFVPVGLHDGRLRFARGSHRAGLAPIEDISDTSEAQFAQIIEEGGFCIDAQQPIFVGDVSFHHGRTIHGAWENTSGRTRLALALHCFADGARIKRPTTPKMAMILRNAAPELAVGDLAESARWPVLDTARRPVDVEMVRGAGPRWHLRATRLDRGGGPVDLWIADGRFRSEPLEDAEPLAAPGGFVTAGLVDAHAHISYPNEPDDPASSVAWMNARRAEHGSTAVALIRDMGAVDDAISQTLVDVPGLPYVLPSGNMILRHEEPPFTPTPPERLVGAFEQRIERGGRWVKVFADWSSDYRGPSNSGFTGDDEVTYPLDLLRTAVAAAHALGGRVAAHCFTRAGAKVAIDAGVDSLEHGWGLDEALVETMAGRGIAWAPLVGIATNMWHIARRDGQPDRVAWIEEAVTRVARLLPLAHARGVTILAGTDTFPTVTIPDEIRQLHELGLGREAALAAGAWGARAWLGEPGIEEGAVADLVLYRTDPREDLAALLSPELVLVGGARVNASFDHVRPQFFGWARRHEGHPA